MCLVDIIQDMWKTGEIPQKLGFAVLVIIPKSTTDTHFIGLLETLWKVVEALIYTRLIASIQFHDVIHRFWEERGMGTAIMDLNIVQELASVDHDLLFLVFLDLWKAYATVDR